MWTSICFCAAVKTGDFAVDEYKFDSTRGFGGFRDSVILGISIAVFHLIWVGYNFGTHCLSVEIILFSFTTCVTVDTVEGAELVVD